MVGAYAHVCALPDAAAVLEFDQPEVQQVRRDALAWWIALLGDTLVCLTTLALDASRYGGAITVTREPVAWSEDPFARIFPAPSFAAISSARSPRRPARCSNATPASPGRAGGFERSSDSLSERRTATRQPQQSEGAHHGQAG